MANRLWEEVKREDGSSSLQTHTPKEIKTFCSNHYWVYVSPTSREITCKHCGLGGHIVLGLHMLVDGKIIEIKGYPKDDSPLRMQ